jgi:hypothetical protein
MKKQLIILAASASLSIMANATERSPLTGAVINNISQSRASAGAIATGGNAGSVSNSNDFNAAAASAIAPSVGTNNNCLIATPSSAAVNILFGGISKTTGFHYSGLCLAYRMNNLELAEKLMCLEDKNFAKLNPKCK